MKKIALIRPIKYSRYDSKGRRYKIGNYPYTLRYKDDEGEHQISTGCKLKGEATEWAREFLNKGVAGKSLADAKKTILEHLQVNQYRPKTIEMYEHVFRVLAEIGKPLNEIGIKEINSFKVILGGRNTGINSRLRTLHAIMEKAKDFRIISEVPKIEMLPETKDVEVNGKFEPIRTNYTLDETREFINWVYNGGEWRKSGTRKGQLGFSSFKQQMEMYKYVVSAYTLGLRRGETLSLNLKMCLEEIIPIIQQKLRGGQRVKYIPVNSEFRLIVVEPMVEAGLPLTTPIVDLKEDYITHKVKDINRALGFPETLKNHSFRHTHITELEKEIGLKEVSPLVGHTNLKTTQGYVGSDFDKKIQQVNRLPVLTLVEKAG